MLVTDAMKFPMGVLDISYSQEHELTVTFIVDHQIVIS